MARSRLTATDDASTSCRQLLYWRSPGCARHSGILVGWRTPAPTSPWAASSAVIIRDEGAMAFARILPVFVDRVQIELQAGAGGHGCVSFRRERYVPKGGPDGGDGGRGGSVILVGRRCYNLAAFAGRKSWKAESGKHGEGSNRHGRRGHDLILPVPPGTLLIDAKQGYVIRDLAQDGDTVVAAKGGRGGRGNLHFKTSTNRAPCEQAHPNR